MQFKIILVLPVLFIFFAIINIIDVFKNVYLG